MQTHHPEATVEILDRETCLRLLATQRIGRLAVEAEPEMGPHVVPVNYAALRAVFPVNYALLGDEIVFLTGEGTKLRAAAAEAVVAFEVDDFDATRPYGWSVLAVGVAQGIADPEQLSAARD